MEETNLKLLRSGSCGNDIFRHTVRLFLFFIFFGIHIYNAQHLWSYKDTRSLVQQAGWFEV
jgi:hypothetical protein